MPRPALLGAIANAGATQGVGRQIVPANLPEGWEPAGDQPADQLPLVRDTCRPDCQLGREAVAQLPQVLPVPTLTAGTSTTMTAAIKGDPSCNSQNLARRPVGRWEPEPVLSGQIVPGDSTIPG